MRLHIDFEMSQVKYRKLVTVGIVRGNKDRVAYSTGLIYFYHEESLGEYQKTLSQKLPHIQFYMVDIYGGNNEPDSPPGRGYWCPYCRSWEYWLADAGGYKRCPICGMSDSDFYVKKFNKLWVTKMQTKKDKQYAEKMKEKASKPFKIKKKRGTKK